MAIGLPIFTEEYRRLKEADRKKKSKLPPQVNDNDQSVTLPGTGTFYRNDQTSEGEAAAWLAQRRRAIEQEAQRRSPESISARARLRREHEQRMQAIEDQYKSPEQLRAEAAAKAAQDEPQRKPVELDRPASEYEPDSLTNGQVYKLPNGDYGRWFGSTGEMVPVVPDYSSNQIRWKQAPAQLPTSISRLNIEIPLLLRSQHLNLNQRNQLAQWQGAIAREAEHPRANADHLQQLADKLQPKVDAIKQNLEQQAQHASEQQAQEQQEKEEREWQKAQRQRREETTKKALSLIPKAIEALKKQHPSDVDLAAGGKGDKGQSSEAYQPSDEEIARWITEHMNRYDRIASRSADRLVGTAPNAQGEQRYPWDHPAHPLTHADRVGLPPDAFMVNPETGQTSQKPFESGDAMRGGFDIERVE